MEAGVVSGSEEKASKRKRLLPHRREKEETSSRWVVNPRRRGISREEGGETR